jgi:hypothetical protein
MIQPSFVVSTTAPPTLAASQLRSFQLDKRGGMPTVVAGSAARSAFARRRAALGNPLYR